MNMSAYIILFPFFILCIYVELYHFFAGTDLVHISNMYLPPPNL